MRQDIDFETFAVEVRPRLLRAFAGCRGFDDAADATAEAMAYGWEHWQELRTMENPAGYLFRVGQTKTRRRQIARLPLPADLDVPEVEPRLVPALLGLPETQRTAVWLVNACQWSYGEVAEAMGTSVSMVGNHVRRGLDRLREVLEVSRCD